MAGPRGDPLWIFLTRDGNTLLFNGTASGSRNLWIAPLGDIADARQITFVPGDAIAHSSLSPDGSRVAFVSIATGNSDVWVQNVDGTDLRQLTNDVFADSWPVWSPDGRWIAFTSLRNSRQETWRIPAAGGPAEKLFDGFFRGDWRPQLADGNRTWIVTSNGQDGVRLLDVERRAVIWDVRVPGTGLSLPMFSPDGRSFSMPFQAGAGPRQHRHLRHGIGRAPTDHRDAVSRVLPCGLGRAGLHVHRQPQCQHLAHCLVRSVLVEWTKRAAS